MLVPQETQAIMDQQGWQGCNEVPEGGMQEDVRSICSDQNSDQAPSSHSAPRLQWEKLQLRKAKSEWQRLTDYEWESAERDWPQKPEEKPLCWVC